jgi:hypothetical protein
MFVQNSVCVEDGIYSRKRALHKRGYLWNTNKLTSSCQKVCNEFDDSNLRREFSYYDHAKVYQMREIFLQASWKLPSDIVWM